MATSTTKTNKPLNPRGNDQSPLAYNRAKLYSGKALDFDGVNDYVDLDGFTMSGNTGTFTFNFYSENNTSFRYLFDAEGSGRFIIGLGNVAGEIQLYDGAFKSVFVPKQNTWINFVVSVNGTIASCYVNGKHEIDVTISPIDLSSTTNVAVGSRSDGTTSFWSGQIAGFKIFNTALTAAQVADLYNNPEKVVPTGVDNTALKLWLPMMEGAGTTAYDGSGNGNHGTISGATYVNGIGAPVAQSAVMDWNKGTNKIVDSELYTTSVSFRGMTKNSTTEESPIGTFDAIKMTENNTNGNPALILSTTDNNNRAHTAKVYLKADTATSIAFATNGSSNSGNINVTTEWQAFEVTQSINAVLSVHIGGFSTIAQGSGIVLYVWHPQLQEASSAGPYVGTFGTSQPTPVLLPQGLTSGRDITGVNLFENVRKQGALNLDGNSWAEVHDNASVDLTTSLSLEVWCYPTEDGTQGGRELIGKFISGSSPYQCWALEYNNNFFDFGIGATDNTWSIIASSTGKTKENWYHVVATYDGATRKIYVDGVEEGTAAFTKTPQTTDKNIAIGRWLAEAVGGNNTFFGPIAQPRIYNRALTAEEVQRSYDSGKNIYTNS